MIKTEKTFWNFWGKVISDFNWVCHAYYLMSNHYHLLVETPDGNLSKGMRQLNGVFTQHRIAAKDVDTYLLELTRYVVLNPVRAGIVRYAGQWHWSCY